MRSKRFQRGTGLVELLVALVIGLLISVAALGTMAHSRATAATLGEAMRLHQDSAIAMRIIEHQVRQAGARKLKNAAGGMVEFQEINPNAQPAMLDGTQGAGTAPDTLRTGLDADTSIDARDCLGKEPEGNRILSRFELFGGNLRCLGSGDDTPAPLIEGVEDFQVLYAIRTGQGVQYVEKPGDWGLVQGVKVCLRLVSPARGTTSSTLTGCRDEPVANDGRMRRVVTRVIHLRNGRA
ncbi:PilW family protein [Hydrogenophaga sp.]|uniref:PilW family protein n=1 Tax=Hydrogenophaga sp. TaxID=1904254 RepID=UPI003F71348D